MAGLASINIKFSADLAQFSTEIQRSSRQIKKLGSELEKIGTTLSLGVTAPILAFGVASVMAFDESAKAIAQVDAALKSTGGTVGFNSEQLQQMAADLQSVTTFDDDQILKEATANLLTFNKITGDTFVQAQKAALDLATRLNGDLQTATLQIGKALQDPIKGINALSKAGVSFSSEQKAVIKQMVATNNIAGAQAIILKELNKEFGGSAEAAAKAGTGSFKQLGNQIGDLSEEFGKIIVDALQPFVEGIKNIVTSIQQLSPEAKKVIAVIGGIAAVIGPTVLAFGTIISLVPTFVTGLTAMSGAFTSFTAIIAANPIGAIAVAVGLAAGAFLLFNNETKKTVKQQSDLNQLNTEAVTLIAKQKADLDSLVSIAKNEALSKKERLEAIKEINKISPEYLGNLNLENIATDKARQAIENYNIALLAGAKARIAQQKIQEITNKQAQQEIDAIVNASEVEKAKSDLKKKGITDESNLIENLGKKYKANQEAQKKQYQDIYDANKKYIDLVKDVIAENDNLSNSQSQIIKPGTIAFYENEIALLQKKQKTLSTTGNEYYLLGNRIREYQKIIKDLSPEEVVPIDLTPIGLDKLQIATTSIEKINQILAGQAAGIKTTLEGVKQDLIQFQEDVNQAIEASVENLAIGIGAAIGQVVSNGGSLLSSLSGLVFSTLGDLLIELGKIAIRVGISIEAIKESLKSLNPVVAVVAGIAAIALGTYIKNQVSGLAGFAEGGIVGGNSFYGDKILARVNSGELILNTRQQRALYGQLNTDVVNTMAIIPDVRLKGEDLLIVFNRAQNKKDRLG